MPLVASTLASDLASALGVSVTSKLTIYAQGVIAALTSGSFSNAPGTINGTTASGATLTLGSGSGGVLTLSSSNMTAITVPAFPGATELVAENTAVVNYLATATISFAPGSINGLCSSTPTSPGPLVGGTGTGGTMTGITGSGCYSAVLVAWPGGKPKQPVFYNTLINYILANASCSYASGSVNGICPISAGPLTAGSGTGGTIS